MGGCPLGMSRATLSLDELMMETYPRASLFLTFAQMELFPPSKKKKKKEEAQIYVPIHVLRFMRGWGLVGPHTWLLWTLSVIYKGCHLKEHTLVGHHWVVCLLESCGKFVGIVNVLQASSVCWFVWSSLWWARTELRPCWVKRVNERWNNVCVHRGAASHAHIPPPSPLASTLLFYLHRLPSGALILRSTWTSKSLTWRWRRNWKLSLACAPKLLFQGEIVFVFDWPLSCSWRRRARPR